MKEIKIEDDLFEELLNEVVKTGKNFSQVIRDRNKKIQNGQARSASATSGNNYDEELRNYIEGPDYLSKRSKIAKFLDLLSFIHRQKTEQFSKVLNISGRSRKYFAETEEELQESGTKVFPRNIPNTDFWVISNSSTDQKKDMISDVLRILNYDDTTIRNVKKSIGS